MMRRMVARRLAALVLFLGLVPRRLFAEMRDSTASVKCRQLFGASGRIGMFRGVADPYWTKQVGYWNGLSFVVIGSAVNSWNDAFASIPTAPVSVTLNWAKATDDVSIQPSLQYEVRQSVSPNINSIVDAETNGDIVQPYTADIQTATIGGLNPFTSYFFTVVVKDEAGNKAAYCMQPAVPGVTSSTQSITGRPIGSPIKK